MLLLLYYPQLTRHTAASHAAIMPLSYEHLLAASHAFRIKSKRLTRLYLKGPLPPSLTSSPANLLLASRYFSHTGLCSTPSTRKVCCHLEGLCTCSHFCLEQSSQVSTWLSFSSPSVQFSSVTQSCPTLCDPMNCSTPGLPVHHQLLEFTQTHVH